jgi:hypothetical protein
VIPLVADAAVVGPPNIFDMACPRALLNEIIHIPLTLLGVAERNGL